MRNARNLNYGQRKDSQKCVKRNQEHFEIKGSPVISYQQQNHLEVHCQKGPVVRWLLGTLYKES